MPVGWKPDLLMAVPLAASFVLYGVGASRVRVPPLELAAFLARHPAHV